MRSPQEHINSARMRGERLDEYTDVLRAFWAYGMAIVIGLAIGFAVAATWPQFVEYQMERTNAD